MVLAAEPPSLERVLGGHGAVGAFLRNVREAIELSLRSETVEGPILSNSTTLIDYLTASMARLTVEQVRVLYLDLKNRLLHESIVEGSVRDAPIYPREIIRRALELGASGLILVHNHPSGDPRPSQADIGLTRSLANAAYLFDIQLHDHILIARSGYESFRALGLL